MSYKEISILSSDDHFVQRSKPVGAMLVEGTMETMHVKLFSILPCVSEGAVI